MEARVRQLVRNRAEYRCEYCSLEQEREPLLFHIEHIIPRQHHGSDAPENLALACHHCNLHKGPNVAAFDPVTGMMTRLFHPRTDKWSDHFVIEGPEVKGVSEMGRATAALLRMNLTQRLQLRS